MTAARLANVGRFRQETRHDIGRGAGARLLDAGISRVDLALLGAALIIIGERVYSVPRGASNPSRLPKSIKPVDADESFELSLSSLRDANAEVSLLHSLVGSVRSSVASELKQSQVAEAVSNAYGPTRVEQSLEQYLADNGRSLSSTPLNVDGAANISGRSYINEMETLQNASQEFLNIMRQLFAEELDSVAERQKAKPAEEEAKEEVAKEETAEDAQEDMEQEVADDGGLGSPWMGLLGLAGGGGGGGGVFGGGGSFSMGGAAIDGYVSGATVFWDINSNWILDGAETSYTTTTDSTGNYTLSGITAGVGQIVIMDDGIDTSTGGSVGMMAMSTANATDAANANVTPLTMLAAYGVTDETLATILFEEHTSGDIDVSGIDFHSFDPVEILEAGADDAETGGVILLKAQQIFAVVNAISGLLKEAGSTQADAVASTVSALSTLSDNDLRSLVGELSTDADIDSSNAVLSTILAGLAPDFADVTVTDDDDIDSDGNTTETITLAQKLASAITETNSVIGAEVASPELALEESARAAALITQNDLVSEFKEIGQLDPATAAADIATKISASFSDAESIKAGFHEAYKSHIADSLDSAGGIITAVDDVIVKAGQGKLIAASEIIANDTNTGSGDLTLVSVSPASLVYQTQSTGLEKITIQGEPGATIQIFDNGVDITASSTVKESAVSPGTYTVGLYELSARDAGLARPEYTANIIGASGVAQPIKEVGFAYELHTPDPSAWSEGDYVRLDIGPIKVETRYGATDTPSSVAARLIEEASTTLKGDQAPFTIQVDPDRPHVLLIEDRAGNPLRDRKTGESVVKLEKASDPFADSHFDAQLVTIDGTDYIQVNSDKASSVRLKYTLANDDGQGVGLIRLTVEPEFGKLETPRTRPETVLEDDYTHADGIKYSEVQLGSHFLITQTEHTADIINERLIFKLDADMPDGIKLKLANGELVTLSRGPSGKFKAQQIDIENPPSLLLPTNYHGDVTFGFALHSRVDTSDGAVFTDRSEIPELTVAVIPAAEAPADQAEIQIFIGDEATVSGDLEGSIIPSVEGQPSESQTTRLKLSGGDPNESHSISFFNIPDGMSVFVGENALPVVVQFGSFTLNNVELDAEIPIRFESSEALLGSSFGLTSTDDPIRAVVTGTEKDSSGLVIAEAQGDEVNFQFDIGGTFGLTVTSKALTVSDEDVAALIGSLDASIGDGAQLETQITISDGASTLGRYSSGEFEKFNFVSGQASYNLDVSGVTETISVTKTLNTDGSATFVLSATSSDIAALYLEGLAILPSNEHFKGTLSASASFSASKPVTNQLGEPLTDAQGNPVMQQLASVSRGPLTLRFDPVPDGVSSYDTSVNSLVAQEDHSIPLSGLFLTSGETIAQKIDSDETLVYSVSNIPDIARLVDGASFEGLSGEALAVAIAEAPLTGRLVGDAVQLTAEQAKNAHLVVAADQHLDASLLNLSAFTREPTTGDESSSVNDSASVEITAVADTPYVSFDSGFQTRGLVNVFHTAESGVEGASYLSELGLSDKAQIKLPITMALEDLDGSETLWAWVTPYAYETDGQTVSDSPTSLAEFTFETSVDPSLYGKDGSSFVIKGSELGSLSVSRSSDYGILNGFDGIFRVEAVALEGQPDTVAAAIAGRATGISGIDYAIPSPPAELKVEFLQPATKPTLSLQTADATDSIDVTLAIGPDGVTDIVTILATGVPTGSVFVNDEGIAIGARAEVDGVWVLPSSVFGTSGSAETVKIKLPANYDGSKVVDFTAYAVDSLGLTSAASETVEFNAALTTGASVADPIVLDLDGDGVEFSLLTETDQDGRPLQFFDIDGNGSLDRLTGWLSPDSDDYFLVALDTDVNGEPQIPASMSGYYLFTEYLVSPASTNAAEDLISFEAEYGNSDGTLTTSEIESGLARSPFLWRDSNSDGEITRNEISEVSADFSLDVSGFDDTVVVDSVTGAIVVASTDPGSVSGSIEASNLTFSNSVIRDVFLPVAPADASSNVVKMVEQALLAGTGYAEDNPDGFELKGALLDPLGGDNWHTLFGESAAAAIDSGTNVLLSVRAKNAGTYFNLSQGARLEGQATDTWLTIWDGQSPSDEFSLRMFLDDHFSGEVPLEVRATVVYTENGAINEATVSRNLTLSVSAEADRPDVGTPDAVIDVDGEGRTLAETEAVNGLLVQLSGVTASSVDAGESVSVQLKTTFEIANQVDFLLDGARISAEPDPDAPVPGVGDLDTRTYIYTLKGPISDGQLSAILDQYAAGRFDFLMDVSSNDGSDVSTVSGLPFGFKVEPVAQPADIQLTPQSAVSENDSLGFDIQVEPIDSDGSEFVSDVTVAFRFRDENGNFGIHPGTGETIVVEVNGSTYPVLEFDGIFSANIPAEAMTPVDGSTVGARTLTGSLKLPNFFDGSVEISASATTVESEKLTQKATSNFVNPDSGEDFIEATVTAIADGFVTDGFQINGARINGGESFTLAEVLFFETLDPDETVTVTFQGIPEDAVTQGGQRVGSDWIVSGIDPSSTDLSQFVVTVSDMQDDFSLDVAAFTVDGERESAPIQSTLFIASSPLFTPELVDQNGIALQNLSLIIEEDGTGILSDVNVLVGGILNPRDSTVEITLPEEPKLSATILGGSQITPVITNAGVAVLQLSAADLARGIEFSSADPSNPNLSGAFGDVLSISASFDYNGQLRVANPVSVDLTVAAVTDGVGFNFNEQTPLALNEDEPVGLLNIFSLSDTLETIESITFGQSALLELRFDGNDGSGTTISLADSPHTFDKQQLLQLETASLVSIPNGRGSGFVDISITTLDEGRNGASSADSLTQNQTIGFDISAVADEPIDKDGNSFQSDVELLSLFVDETRSEFLNATALVNDGRVDQGAFVPLYLSMEPFSSPDSTETVEAILSGNGIVDGSSLIVVSGSHEGIYDAVEISGSPGSYQISVPGIGGQFEGLEGVIEIPKVNSGYGTKSITATARTIDGTLSNDKVFETESFSILSTIPPAPFVQLKSDIDLASLGDGALSLEDIVRVSNGNSSLVIELFDLPNGTRVEGSGVEQIAVRSNDQSLSKGGFRVSFDDLGNTILILPDTVISGSAQMTITARVGTSDGTVNGLEDGATRYVYSRLVPLEGTIGGETESNDFIIVSDDKVVDAGSGDDQVFVSGLGSGSINAGDGKDSLVLSNLNASDGTIVDLNMGLLIVNSDKSVNQSEVIRDISGFEVIVGSSGDDIIVGEESPKNGQVLRGGDGDDRIFGGVTDDFLDGGPGDDFLNGGLGADRFVLSPGGGTDLINDFDWQLDTLVVSGFGISLQGGELPVEVSLQRSVESNVDSDWIVSISKTDVTSGQILNASALLIGSGVLALSDLEAQLQSDDGHHWIQFTDEIDLEGSDPERSRADYGVDLGNIVNDESGYADSFFGSLDFGETDLGEAFDPISEALGVIADAKFEGALIARFTNKNSEVSVDYSEESISDFLGAYEGLSGSMGNDVLIGLDEDSVLYGGDGGSDRMVGGSGDDILIASMDRSESQVSEDELTGGSGSDVFAFVKAETVDAGLQNVHDVLVKDFNRDEGDRLLLVGYDDVNDVVIHDVDINTNTQSVSLEDGLTVMFDLSFAREFDTNFALRLADFDKFEG